MGADTIYTLKLRRRGIDLGRRETIPGAARVTVGSLMSPMPRPIDADGAVAEAATRLAAVEGGVLPLADCQDGYLGVVTARTISDALASGTPDQEPVRGLGELPARLLETDFVDAGVEALDASGLEAIPVLDDRGREVVGWFDRRTALTQLAAKRLPG